ncbi:hypothetical protein NHQ30_000015 [Ciborinia camelliae]|nr:hypothetical protein NHQ30_000015 [Ciborinia camelliae]
MSSPFTKEDTSSPFTEQHKMSSTFTDEDKMSSTQPTEGGTSVHKTQVSEKHGMQGAKTDGKPKIPPYQNDGKIWYVPRLNRWVHPDELKSGPGDWKAWGNL